MLSFVLATLGTSTPTLFFSQYQEGASNNKFIQIYNPTGATVALSMTDRLPEFIQWSFWLARVLERVHQRRDDRGRRLLHDLPSIGRFHHPVIVRPDATCISRTVMTATVSPRAQILAPRTSTALVTMGRIRARTGTSAARAAA